MKKFIFLICLFSYSSVTADHRHCAFLECKSKDGQTVFTACLVDLEDFLRAEFSIDGESLNYDAKSRVRYILAVKQKILSLKIYDTKTGGLTLYAIPETFESLYDEDYPLKHYKFVGVLQGADPRKNIQQSKLILDCSLIYN